LSLSGMLVEEVPQRSKGTLPITRVAGLVLISIALVLSYITNFRMVQADIVFRMGNKYTQMGQWALASQAYQRSIDLQPEQDYYGIQLGLSFLDQLNNVDGADSIHNTLFLKTEQAFKQAQAMNPLNPTPSGYLGNLYSQQAIIAVDKKSQGEYYQKADQQYSLVIKLSPYIPDVWYDRAFLVLNLGQTEQAREWLNKALELNPYYVNAYALSGSMDIQQALALPAGEMREDALQSAAENYQEAIRIGGNTYEYLIAMATIYTEMKDYPQAVGTYLVAEQFVPKQDRWRLYFSLAILYLDSGDKINALRYARFAQPLVPSGSQDMLQGLLGQINQ